jgi:uncharacterized protein (UPF0212 family)
MRDEAEGERMSTRPIVGFFLTVMGGFVAALNLATMFPSETYEASWGKVAIATALAVFGGFLNKSNTENTVDVEVVCPDCGESFECDFTY